MGPRREVQMTVTTTPLPVVEVPRGHAQDVLPAVSEGKNAMKVVPLAKRALTCM